MNKPKTKFTTKNIRPQEGKNILITGGNSGLGFECAKVLASKGANLIIACRDKDKGEKAREEISKLGKAEFKLLDLASLNSIHKFCDELIKEKRYLDTLINNAGVMSIEEKTLTEDGLETQMAINYFGHFVLTNRLLPLLEKFEEPRVVSVSSVAAYNTNINLSNLNSEIHYDPYKVYKRTKLANLLFANELGWRYPWLTSVSAHPGVCKTNIKKHLVPSLKKGFSIMSKCIGHSVSDGALPILYAATKDNLTSGAYFGPSSYTFGAVSKVKQPKEARKNEKAEQLWNFTKELLEL